ncbi:MAG: helix-turn-helix domain-containing protein, partial [Thermodesulfobacteriota bacterium]|nr:helix-turn-helix domain-containing protein [Thermodesulfobacteriota bacterium]
ENNTVPHNHSLKKAAIEKEKELLIEILRSTKGNIKKSSKIIGISRVGLYQKLKRFGLEAYINHFRTGNV